MNTAIGHNKAALIYRILGESLPMEVFNHFSSDEIEKLLSKLDQTKIPGKKEEASVLREFNTRLKNSLNSQIHSPNKQDTTSYSKNSIIATAPQQAYSHADSDDSRADIWNAEEERIIREIQSIIEEENSSNTNSLEILVDLSPEELSKLILDESPVIIAQVLYFCPQETASRLMNGLPQEFRRQVFEEFGNLDFDNVSLKDDLERLLRFKHSMIQSNGSPRKVKQRQGQKAAELLSILNPKESREILSKIQKKRPQFAENIIEHYYSFNDLLLLGRTSLSRFFEGFHSVVLATALKGVEKSLKEEILASIEPWIAKEIRLESDSIGAVSLAEIEESHRGILDRLREEIEEGRVKLWRFR
ncbi:FliG C-terminal domain-containing protein [Leptospira sp. GIMC2001]|uniref:FliG C-terminal domain-containing protein n=1 Tax=Leptospira sp. GIMC2001 TaxID=1513297 RepID=UPI0004A5C46A|nr:FliG C-terminal domain-containing protein [Leptospira sp. GIMC2001]AID56227.1 flagellar motor switch protein FliG [Leptospira sp. GIMC2001]WCL48528.1 hypothetical protein O4O04_14635 [Leptospira sp. GIMC2001]